MGQDIDVDGHGLALVSERLFCQAEYAIDAILDWPILNLSFEWGVDDHLNCKPVAKYCAVIESGLFGGGSTTQDPLAIGIVIYISLM